MYGVLSPRLPCTVYCHHNSVLLACNARVIYDWVAGLLTQALHDYASQQGYDGQLTTAQHYAQGYDGKLTDPDYSTALARGGRCVRLYHRAPMIYQDYDRASIILTPCPIGPISLHHYPTNTVPPRCYQIMLASRSTQRKNGMEPTMPNTLYVAMEREKTEARTARQVSVLAHLYQAVSVLTHLY